MGVVVPHKAIDAVSNAADPKQAILDFVGDLSDMDFFANRVLVGTYMRPEKTKGGIIRPDANKEEDVWQGKVGLVLKLGTEAFLDSDQYKFAEEDKAKVGDWVIYNVGDGRSISIVNMETGKEYPCRIIRDSSIIGKTKNPNRAL